MALVVPERDHLRPHGTHDHERIARTAQERFIDHAHATHSGEPCALTLERGVALDATDGAVARDDHDETVPECTRFAQVVLVARMQEIERPEREHSPHVRTRSRTVK